MSRLNFWLGALLVLLVSGCARLQPLPADWSLDAREQQLSAIAAWQMQGKLGIKAPGDSGSVYVNWAQGTDRYDITLSGPLGQGSGSITGTADEVVLEQGGQTLRADSAEELVLQAFGWQLPMQALTYWVRGLPAPELAGRQSVERDAQGLIIAQEQAGWTLEYSQYKLVQGLALPGKLKAESSRLGVRLILVVNDWTLGVPQ